VPDLRAGRRPLQRRWRGRLTARRRALSDRVNCARIGRIAAQRKQLVAAGIYIPIRERDLPPARIGLRRSSPRPTCFACCRSASRVSPNSGRRDKLVDWFVFRIAHSTAEKAGRGYRFPNEPYLIGLPTHGPPTAGCSRGEDFAEGAPLDAAWAVSRPRWAPVVPPTNARFTGTFRRGYLTGGWRLTVA
jgi:hypothetical protein